MLKFLDFPSNINGLVCNFKCLARKEKGLFSLQSLIWRTYFYFLFCLKNLGSQTIPLTFRDSVDRRIDTEKYDQRSRWKKEWDCYDVVELFQRQAQFTVQLPWKVTTRITQQEDGTGPFKWGHRWTKFCSPCFVSSRLSDGSLAAWSLLRYNRIPWHWNVACFEGIEFE